MQVEGPYVPNMNFIEINQVLEATISELKETNKIRQSCCKADLLRKRRNTALKKRY